MKTPDTATEVRRLLSRYARSRNEDFQLVLINYALERLLYRISRSAHSTKFVLKGAMLFRLWTNQPHRATRDLDLLGWGNSDASALEATFKDICLVNVEDDGLIFLPETVKATEIRETQEYGGIRIIMEVHLQKARIPVQVDVGFGDAITPAAVNITFPTLLEFSPPMLLAYPRETVVAEKLEAIVKLGMINSRMKDFYDLYVISRIFSFDRNVLATAINATFKRRETLLPAEVPVAFTPEFYFDKLKMQQWAGFQNKLTILDTPQDLDAIVLRIHDFLMPCIQAIAENSTGEIVWVGDHWLQPTP